MRIELKKAEDAVEAILIRRIMEHKLQGYQKEAAEEITEAVCEALDWCAVDTSDIPEATEEQFEAGQAGHAGRQIKTDPGKGKGTPGPLFRRNQRFWNLTGNEPR